MTDLATTPPVPTPAPTLDEIEATLDALLAADPAVLTRLQGFFGKLRRAKPVVDLLLSALSALSATR